MADYDYGSWQGELALYALDSSGLPTGLPNFVGDVNAFEIKGSTDEITVKENLTGRRNVVVHIPTGTNLEGTINFRRVNPENAALMMLGAVVEVALGTVSAEAIPTVVAGNVVLLARHGRITSLVITDSTGSPITLVANTDYVHDGTGKVTFLTATGVQPYHAAYSVAAVTKVIANVTDPPIRQGVMRGIDTAEQTNTGAFKRKDTVFFRMQFRYTESLALINENDVASTAVPVALLPDPNRVPSNTTSQYYEEFYLDT